MKILHVDDDKMELDLFRVCLGQLSKDVQISISDSVKKALAILDKQNFDCIISDYQMPELNGLQFLQTLRMSGNDTPFIFLTGLGNEELAVEALRAGADDYYCKEGGLAFYDRLFNRVQKIVESHRNNKALDLKRLYLQNILDCTPIAVALTKVDGEILQINKRFTELFDYLATEANGQNLDDLLVPPHLKEEAIKQTLQASRTEVPPYDSMRKHKSGSLINVTIQGFPIISRSGEIVGVYALYRDFPEPTCAEKELAKAEISFKS